MRSWKSDSWRVLGRVLRSGFCESGWFSDPLSTAPSDSGNDRSWPLRPMRRGLSLRWCLGNLIAASVAPILSFSLGYQYLAYRQAVVAAGQETLPLARSMSLLVDEELQVRIAALQTLAISRSLTDGDFDGFRGLAETVVTQEFPVRIFCCWREDGKQLINTGLPYDAVPPMGPDAGAARVRHWQARSFQYVSQCRGASPSSGNRRAGQASRRYRPGQSLEWRG